MTSTIPTRVRLSNRFIENLPPQEPDANSTNREISDTEVSGLRVLVGKTGNKNFLLRYTWRGRKRSVALGGFGPLKVTNARQIANEYKGMIARGIDPQAEIEKQKRSMTLEEYMEQRYFPLYSAKKRKGSERMDRSRFRHHIQQYLGKCLIDEITLKDLLQLQNRLNITLAKSTTNRVTALLKHAFTVAETTFGLIERNPAKGLKLLSEAGNERKRLMTPDEIRRLFASCNQDENYYMGQYVKFLLLTGTRRNEAAQARWEHLRLNEQPPTWYLPHTKNGRPRTVYLNRMAVELLVNLEREQGNPYVFPGGYSCCDSGYRGPITSPYKAFQRILKRARIEEVVNGEKLVLHSLRHAHGGLLASAGASLSAIQFSLGHTTSRVTERYVHLSQEAIERTGQQVVSFVERALEAS